MKHLVFIFTVFFATNLWSDVGPSKIKKGNKVQEVTSETEIGDLAHKFDFQEKALRLVEMANLPLTLNQSYSDSPFLYFFNGVSPKDHTDPRVWYFDGHYMTIQKFGEKISVNNLFSCTSLKLDSSGTYLNCVDGNKSYQINFDGTIRNGIGTKNVCPAEGVHTALYGNCVITITGSPVRCTADLNWSGAVENHERVTCKEIEIINEVLHCRRDRIKNSETVDLSGKCLTDSSIMLSPSLNNLNRFQQLNESGAGTIFKEPQGESRSK